MDERAVIHGTLGNWRADPEELLRFRPDLTMNKGFFSALAQLLQTLPYLHHEYLDRGIVVQLRYFSHNYGGYPNFEVMGDLLRQKLQPTQHSPEHRPPELRCLSKLHRRLCGEQDGTVESDRAQRHSYGSDFQLARAYFDEFLEFHPEVRAFADGFVDRFGDRRVLGLHFRATDKNRVSWVHHTSADQFLDLTDYHLRHHAFDAIFVATDDRHFIEALRRRVDGRFEVLHLDAVTRGDRDAIHLDWLLNIAALVGKLKAAPPNQRAPLGEALRMATQQSRRMLELAIADALILSRCHAVLKTHSQLSAFAKIMNPALEIYRVNGSSRAYWPDSHIPLYAETRIRDRGIRSLATLLVDVEVERPLKGGYRSFPPCEPRADPWEWNLGSWP